MTILTQFAFGRKMYYICTAKVWGRLKPSLFFVFAGPFPGKTVPVVGFRGSHVGETTSHVVSCGPICRKKQEGNNALELCEKVKNVNVRWCCLPNPKDVSYRLMPVSRLYSLSSFRYSRPGGRMCGLGQDNNFLTALLHFLISLSVSSGCRFVPPFSIRSVILNPLCLRISRMAFAAPRLCLNSMLKG